MTPGQRVVEAWTRLRPGLPVAFGAVVLGALLAAGEPAPYGVSGLLVLLGLALVVPGLDRARAAVATSGGAVAVVAVRLLSGELGPADAWSGGATVVAVLALGWAVGEGRTRATGTGSWPEQSEPPGLAA